MLRLFINNKSYTNFEDITVRKSFVNLCNTLEVKLGLGNNENNENDYPIQLGDRFILYYNDQTMMAGYIETIEETLAFDEHEVLITGRDLTVDLLHSTVDNETAPQIKGGFYLDQIAQQLINKLNMPIRAVYDSETARPFFDQNSYITPNLGETGYHYLERYAKKGQVYLNTTSDGNLNIASANGAQTINNKLILSKNEGSKTNILEGKLTYRSDALFNQYRCHAQSNTLPLYLDRLKNIDEFKSQVTNVLGVAKLDGVRASRIYNFIADTSMDKQTATKRAALQANYSRSNYFQYQAKVGGFTYDGTNLWDTNIKVHVTHTNRLNAVLLISEVVYTLDTSGAEKCLLTLVFEDAFSAQAERTSNQKQGQQIGNIYNATQ